MKDWSSNYRTCRIGHYGLDDTCSCTIYCMYDANDVHKQKKQQIRISNIHWPIHWLHGICLDCSAPLITAKIAPDVAKPVPEVRHMSKNRVTKTPCSSQNILIVTGFIFWRLVSLDPLMAEEKELFFIEDMSNYSKCGWRSMFKMHIVLVPATANPFATFESGKMSTKSGDKWSMVAIGGLWWASTMAILTQALFICIITIIQMWYPVDHTYTLIYLGIERYSSRHKPHVL